MPDTARVTENVDLGESWFRLEVESPLAARVRAGQFVQVRIGAGEDPLVRRPFSVYDLLPEPGAAATRLRLLYQVVGPGTRWMSSRRPSDRIDLLGPLGRPFPDLDPGPDGDTLLVGGGIGVAPLFLYCRERRPGASMPRVLLGARRRSLLVGRDAFLEQDIPVQCATDDGSAGRRGTVIDLLEDIRGENPDKPCSGIGCGPHGMNVALHQYATRESLDFWISLENYMPCGFGACFGCVIPDTRSPERRFRRVCVEGPCFPVRELPAGL